MLKNGGKQYLKMTMEEGESGEDLDGGGGGPRRRWRRTRRRSGCGVVWTSTVEVARCRDARLGAVDDAPV
jgi:hypothetical protein